MTIATMKKFMKSLMLVAVAAMGLTACQNDINEQVNATKGEVTVTFIANSADATRTSVSIDDEKNVTFAWDEEESFVVLESIDGAAPTQALSVDFENVDGLAEISATFEENFDGLEYDYVAVYPATNWVAETYTDLKKHKLIFKTQQTMAEGSYDPTADLMISKLLTLDVQPSNEAFEMEFQRLVAVGKMAVKNLPVVGEEKILSVEFTTGNTNLSGRAYVDLAEGKVTEHGYYGTGAKNVKVSCELAAAATNDIFFTCMPATLAEGETYTITVTTDKASYTKTGTIGAKALEFKAGDVTGFTANMEGVTRNVIEKLEGEYIIVAKRSASSNFFYMTPDLGTASTKRFQAVNTGCAALEEIDVEKEDYTWTIAKSGDYYTISEPNGQFINWTSGNSTALTDAARDLTITKVEGKEYYNIALQNEPSRILSLNSDASYNYFGFYGNKNQICDLYLLPAIVDPRDKQELIFSYTSTTYTLGSEDEFEEPTLVGAQTAVTYASSNEEIATVDAEGNVTFKDVAGTVTITATATEDDDYREGKASYTIKVNPASLPGTGEGTAEDPYDIARAYAVIDNANGEVVQGVYVKGIITSDAISFNPTYSSCTYNISADGSATNKFEVYSGKNLGNTPFESPYQLHAGDEVVVYGDIKKFNNTKYEFNYNNYIVSLNCSHSDLEQPISFVTNPAQVSVGKTVTVSATAYTTITYTSSDTTVATIDETTGVVTGVEEGTATITATATAKYGYKSASVSYEITVVAAGTVVAGGGKADFATITSTSTSYGSGKTTAGWNYKNCAIFKGGNSNSSPAFKMIGDASNRAICMNGKKGAAGTITSPTLNGGCGTLKFNYGLPFSDNKIKFRVDIMQNGEAVKTFTINNTSASKLTLYSHEEEINVAGDFQIVFTNLSPSGSTSNKDRTAIWDVEWTGCAQ